MNNFKKTINGLYLPEGYAKDPKTSSNISWSSILTMLPVLALALALLYELGNASYYGFPVALIKPDASTVLVDIGEASILSLFVVVNFSIYLMTESWRRFIAYLNTFITAPILYLYFKSLFRFPVPGIPIVFGAALLEFMPLIRLPKRDLRQSFQNRSINLLLAIFSLVLVGTMTYLSGFSEGVLQRSYYVISIPPAVDNSIIIKIYGDNMIAAPLSENFTVERSFRVLKISDNLTLTPISFNRNPFR